jgi:hypothetical protein
MPERFQLLRVSDATLIRLAEELLEGEANGSAEFVSAGNTGFSWVAGDEPGTEVKAVFNGNSFLITTATVLVPGQGLTLSYYRGMRFGTSQQNASENWHRAVDTSFIDGIEIAAPRNAKSSLSALGKINTFLSLSPPIPTSLDGSSALDQSALILNRVTEAAARVVEFTTERQKDLDHYRTRLAEEASQSLDEARNRLQSEHGAALVLLQEREADLVVKTAEFEDRSNTHVRRSLQKAMAALADTTLEKKLLERSQAAFLIPAIFALIVIMVIAGLVITETTHLQSLSAALTDAITSSVVRSTDKPAVIASINQSILYGQVRVALSTIAAGLLVWFTLRLATNRYRQISRWEHDLHKFRLDTERASFLIEGELEARKLNGEVLPQVVLDRFSRGLFTNDADQNIDNPDVGLTLAHLLNRPASVKIGPDGATVEIDKGGIRRAAKEAAVGSNEG